MGVEPEGPREMHCRWVSAARGRDDNEQEEDDDREYTSTDGDLPEPGTMGCCPCTGSGKAHTSLRGRNRGSERFPSHSGPRGWKAAEPGLQQGLLSPGSGLPNTAWPSLASNLRETEAQGLESCMASV